MSEKNVTQPLVQGTDQNPQAQIEILFNNLGLATGSISVTANSVQIAGTTPDHRRLVVKQERFGNYRRQTVSEYSGGDINDRREHARRLRAEGLTQKSIAEQLDVSQKQYQII